MVKGYRWLAMGIAGAALVAPGIARAQGAPAEQPLTQPGTASPAAGLPQAQGSFKPPAQIRPGQPVSVLVFPFGFVANEMGAAAAPAAPAVGADPSAPAAAAGLSLQQQHIASYLTASVKAGFLSSPYYAVASYHPNSSLVQRAQKDEILRPEHLTGLVTPATGAPDLEKARTVTYRLGMQGLLVGTIDLKTDAKANTSEVTLETQLINSATGEVIRSAAVSGAAAGAEGVPIDVVEERAALDAAQKVLPAMGIQLVTLPGESTTTPARSTPKATHGKKTKEDKKAEADAKRAAEDARKAEAASKKAQEAAAKKAKEDSEKAERAAREQAAAAEKARRDAEKKAKSSKPSASEAPEAKVQKDDPAQAAQEGAGKPAAVEPASGTPVSIATGVPGTANASGQPIPYGYALGDSRSALPDRDRHGLRVPAWLGVAGFLYGLSFVLF